MPKQCPSCQQMLDESARFCPICGAAVGHIEPTPPTVESGEGEFPSPSGGPLLVGGEPAAIPLPPQLPPSHNPKLTKPALMAGILLGILSAMPILNCCCLLWVGGAGVLAVYFLRNETPGVISAGTGASLGLLTGLFGAFVWQLLEIPLNYVTGPEGMRQAREVILKLENLPPESLEALEKMMELFSDPLNPVFLLFSLLIKLILCGILTTMGGVLGSALLGQDNAKPH